MKVLILIAACVAVAAASQTYDRKEVSYGKRDPGYGYGRRDYGYGYDRRDYGYGYDRRDYGYGNKNYGYGYDRKDDYSYNKKSDYSYDVKPAVYSEKKDDYSYDVKPAVYSEKKDDYSYNVKPAVYSEKKVDYSDDKKADYSYEKKSYGITYYGMYPGKCGNDGLYFRDNESFVFCSNGNSYVQPCAPGTRNSPYQKYSHGAAYSYRDFCDVNLVDAGYAAHKSGYAKH